MSVNFGNASVCQVSSSHGLGNNKARIRLAATSFARSVFSDLFTGRSITNTQVLSKVSSAFGFSSNAVPGSNLHTIGSLKHGGEARFLAHPQSGVTIHYYSNATSSNTFDSGEVRVLMAQALGR